VDSKKNCGIQPAFQTVQRLAHDEYVRAKVDSKVLSDGLDPLDLIVLEKQVASVGLDDDLLVARGLNMSQERTDCSRDLVTRTLAVRYYASHRARESICVKRLE